LAVAAPPTPAGGSVAGGGKLDVKELDEALKKLAEAANASAKGLAEVIDAVAKPGANVKHLRDQLDAESAGQTVAGQSGGAGNVKVLESVGVASQFEAGGGSAALAAL
jgi:hypothetical protein